MIEVNIDGRASDDFIEDSEGSVELTLPDCSLSVEEEEGTAYPATSPMQWCNSAGADIREDSVQVWISIGDPRGAFVMEARRLGDGRIVLHLPYPGESEPHMETEHLHGGTLVVTNTKP